MCDYSECDEIADNNTSVTFRDFPENFTMDDVLEWVNTDMGEYGGYVINANIAESMYYRLKRERRAAK